MNRDNPDRVFENDAEVDALLAQLARDTESLQPREGFNAALMSAIDAEADATAESAAEPAAESALDLSAEPTPLVQAPATTAATSSWLDMLARRGRLPFAAAAAAAALALWWSAQVQQDFDDEVLASFDAVEIIE